MNKKHKLILYLISIIIFSRMFLTPLGIETRFSMGIVALSFILLLETKDYFKKLLPFCIALIPIERFICYTLLEHMSIWEGAIKTLPILGYYCSYMLILYIFSTNFEKGGLTRCYPLLFADILSNTVEVTIRGEVSLKALEYLFLASIIRITLASLLYLIYRYRIIIITKEIHQEKYLSLNLLVSSLEAELFYLKKSREDIEGIMKKAHSLYLIPDLREDVASKALDIAREVHEVKKDYIRITQGIESHLKGFSKENHMSLKGFSEIIKSGTISYIEKVNKNISFSISSSRDITLTNYLSLFIVINNILTNGVDAIEDEGQLSLLFSLKKDLLSIKITDSGKGISRRNIPLLFNPGFTTKYDKKTGEMNTGLGLSHVKNILKELGGTIDIDSQKGRGTIFSIEIPCCNIMKGE